MIRKYQCHRMNLVGAPQSRLGFDPLHDICEARYPLNAVSVRVELSKVAPSCTSQARHSTRPTIRNWLRTRAFLSRYLHRDDRIYQHATVAQFVRLQLPHLARIQGATIVWPIAPFASSRQCSPAIVRPWPWSHCYTYHPPVT